MSDFDANGPSAGQLLKRIRESHGASLEALSSTIKVPVQKLLALESDDRAVLPDPNFNRALAMTVCRALKADPTEVLAAMPAAVATVLTEGKASLNEPYKDFADTGLTFDRGSHVRVSLPKLPLPAIGTIGLLVAAALVYWLPDRSEWPVLNGLPSLQEPAVAVPVQEASEASVVQVVSAVSEADALTPMVAAPASPVVGVDASASSSSLVVLPGQVGASSASAPQVVSAPVTSPKPAALPVVAPAAGQVPPVVSSPSSAPVSKRGKIAMAAKEAVWVEVRDGQGQKIFSRLIKAGETVELQGQPPLKVHAGNAPVLSLTFNGQAVDLAAVTRQNVARIELK